MTPGKACCDARAIIIAGIPLSHVAMPMIPLRVGNERIKLLAAEAVERAGSPGSVIDDCMTIACETGAFHPLMLQRAGKSPMLLDDFLRGLPIAQGTILS